MLLFTKRPLSLGSLAAAALLLGLFGLAQAPLQADEPELPNQPRVLITGFGPFGSHSINPSWEGARGVDGRVIEGHKVVAVRLPVDFREVFSQLPDLIKTHDPAVVIHFGVFATGPLLLERQARNKIGTLNDISGYHPVDGRIVADGPMMYSTRLPEAELLQGMPAAGFEMRPSEDAGAYVCEFTFYSELYFQDQLEKSSSAGFIHVSRMNQPLNQEQLTAAMSEAISIILKKRAADKSAREAAAEPEANPALASTNWESVSGNESPGLEASSAGLDSGVETSSASASHAALPEGSGGATAEATGSAESTDSKKPKRRSGVRTRGITGALRGSREPR